MGQYAQYRQPNFTGVATTPAVTDRQRKKLLPKRGSARLRIPCCCWMTWALHATSALRMSGVSQSIGPQLPAITRFMHTRAPIEFLDRLKSCLLTGVPPKNKVTQVVSAASTEVLSSGGSICICVSCRIRSLGLFVPVEKNCPRQWMN